MANLPTNKFPGFLTSVSIGFSTAADGLSEVADFAGAVLADIQMSTAWTDAVITFKAGPSSAELFDFYGSTGDEVTLQTTANRMITVDPVTFAGSRFWQLRSGTGAANVAQAAARTIKLHLVG